MALTAEQKEQYKEQGYLVFDSLFSLEEVQSLLNRLEDLILERIPQPRGLRIQVEPSVERGESSANSLLEAIRKVEGLVEGDELFWSFATNPKLTDIIADLIGPDIKMFRDALMMKPRRIGSAKPYHQDSAYWSIEPPDLVSCWMALDPASLENGCMRVLPGSHKWGMLKHQHLQDYQVDESELDLSQEVAVPLEPGGCLIFHSLLLHATAPNTSPYPRRAMIVTYMSARSLFTGPPDRKPHFPLIRGREYPGCV